MQNLRQRGRSLRSELDELFRKLRQSPEGLGPGNGPGVDVTQLFSRYIPIAMPVRDASEILCAAGLKVHRRDSAILAGATLEQGFGHRDYVSVEIAPEDSGNVSTVKTLHVTLRWSAL